MDADSCPRHVRELVARAARRNGFEAVFAANRAVPLGGGADGCAMVVCGSAKDSADDYILSVAAADDIVVTKDIPFAARLVERGICAMNDRGFVFTPHNIQDKLMERAFNMNLAKIGLCAKSKKSRYGQAEFERFSRSFSAEVQKRAPGGR